MDNSLSLSVNVPEKLITTKQLAQVLGVSVDSVNRTANKLFVPSAVMRRVIKGGESKVFTEEHRKKLSLSHMGQPSPMKGKTHTEETKTKIREARKKQVGENHPMYGKHHSMETKLKMSTPVYCKELDMKFNSISLACEYSEKHNLKANRPNIIANCKGRRKNSGFIIKDGQKIQLHWSYINETPTTTERENLG